MSGFKTEIARLRGSPAGLHGLILDKKSIIFFVVLTVCNKGEYSTADEWFFFGPYIHWLKPSHSSAWGPLSVNTDL